QGKIDTKIITYTDTASLVTAIMGGHIDWMCLSGPATMPYHKSGDLRIALLTSKWASLPDTPSGPEVGLPGVSLDMWIGLFVHGKTPKPAYDRLVAAVAAAAKDPELSGKLAAAGITLNYKGPDDYRKLIDKDWGIFAEVLKDSGLIK
ncbi:MAG: tripartite tricarboxylate transporter substrate-binding protein, partial [Syntrophaceae bacterium]|nr:tripartite tricarboxylate transporter substrate-binding protein [Syntrophaceae bacterium]